MKNPFQRTGSRPAVLYKYFGPSRTDVLESGRIRFTQPAVFNDPFESSPAYLEFTNRKEMERVSKVEAAEQGIPEEERCQMLNSLFASEKREIYFPLLAKALIAVMSRSVGILSLSEIPGDLLMWAHYAQSHEGFVIGFKSDDPFLSRPDARPGARHDLCKVRYSKTRPVQKYFTHVPLAEMFFTKGSDWSYEREWRIFTDMPQEDVAGLLTALISHIAKYQEFPILPECPLNLFDFPPCSIQSVILGCRSTGETAARVGNIVASKYPTAALFRAISSSTKFNLEFEKIR